MRTLITGVTGFVGGHLARALAQHDPAHEVYGTYRWRSRMGSVEAMKRDLRLCECDVRDASSVRHLIAQVRPDRVFHLAGQSHAEASLHAPADTLATNTVGLVNLLEAVREHHPAPRVLVVGAGDEYGLQHDAELPIVETNPLRPLSAYAVSKVTQDLTGLQYFESYGLHIVRTRAFSHTGPGRDHTFIESRIARQVAEIEAGMRPPRIVVGGLDRVFDCSDVRDVTRAYIMALEAGAAGEVYNICSGRGVRVREMVDMLTALSTIAIEVVAEPGAPREHEAPVAVGSAAKLRAATGWIPEIPLEVTMRDLLDRWRERVRGRGPT